MGTIFHLSESVAMASQGSHASRPAFQAYQERHAPPFLSKTATGSPAGEEKRQINSDVSVSASSVLVTERSHVVATVQEAPSS